MRKWEEGVIGYSSGKRGGASQDILFPGIAVQLVASELRGKVCPCGSMRVCALGWDEPALLARPIRRRIRRLGHGWFPRTAAQVGTICRQTGLTDCFWLPTKTARGSTPRDGGLSIVRLAAPEARKWPGAAVLHALAYHAPRIGWRRHAMRFKHLLTWRCVGASRSRPTTPAAAGWTSVMESAVPGSPGVGLVFWIERIENRLPTTGVGLASWLRRCPSWDAAPPLSVGHEDGPHSAHSAADGGPDRPQLRWPAFFVHCSIAMLSAMTGRRRVRCVTDCTDSRVDPKHPILQLLTCRTHGVGSHTSGKAAERAVEVM